MNLLDVYIKKLHNVNDSTPNFYTLRKKSKWPHIIDGVICNLVNYYVF